MGERRASEDAAARRQAAKAERKATKAKDKPAAEPAARPDGGWERRPARQRRASEDAAARKDAADKAAKQDKRQTVEHEPKSGEKPGSPERAWTGFNPEAADKALRDRGELPDPPAEPEPSGKPDLRVVGGAAKAKPAPAGKPAEDPGIWASRREQVPPLPAAERMLRERDRLLGEPAPKPATPNPAPTPTLPPSRTRRQELNDSQWPEPGRHRAQGDAVAEIQSMREDFPRVIATGQQVIGEAVVTMRQHVAGAVADSPSHQAVKDATDQWAQEMAALAARGDEIVALSRQADQAGYDAADQYAGDPNRHAWME